VAPSREHVLVRFVLVHGFTQTARSWDDVADVLAAHGEVVRVDLPGHGEAGDRRLSFVDTAAYVGDAGGPGMYVGYSMGGRICLRLALDRPDLVEALVLVGASPGIADAEARAARQRSDALLAVDLDTGDTGEFLTRWLSQPMFETTTPRPEELVARRTNSREGLAYALRSLGTGAQEPLWDRLGELRMPVLLVAGEKDEKFRAIAERMAAAVGPNARAAVVPGAGHAVLLDQPAHLADLVADHAAATR
jgi:2-succinyl-6-hydroxy-2,4-cyclohexadiene-1-carboxylate synthase